MAFVPPELSSRARNALPLEIRRALDAQERLRRLAASPNATYADYEAVAILRGDPARDKRSVPAGRWSWHPDGYHLRYFSESYRKTTVEIVRGEPYTRTRDREGRIAELAFADGTALRATYRTDAPPLRDRRFRGIAAHAFERIEIAGRDSGGKLRTQSFLRKGWCFAVDKGARGAAAAFPRYADAGLVRSDAAPLVLAQGGGIDWGDAYERGSEARDRYDFYRDRYEGATRPATDEDIDNIFDDEHYRDGVESATTGDTGDRLGWIAETLERFARALARATDILGGLPDGSSDGSGPVYEPPRETGLPGSAGVQRRGVSGRGF
ncbi:MAG: hypothetical protein K2Q06_02480 [Parvularculaceae bacterium]|nr:hypothetical protein [Parvularculaceae bacterium]